MVLSDSSAGHSFGLEFDDVRIGQISEISGLAQDVIEVKQNTSDGKYLTKKLPGRPKAGEVTLTRARTGDTSFEKWLTASRFGKQAGPGTLVVVVHDHDGTPIKRYKLINAHPRSLETESRTAADTDVLTEKLVITYEGLEVE